MGQYAEIETLRQGVTMAKSDSRTEQLEAEVKRALNLARYAAAWTQAMNHQFLQAQALQ